MVDTGSASRCSVFSKESIVSRGRKVGGSLRRPFSSSLRWIAGIRKLISLALGFFGVSNKGAHVYYVCATVFFGVLHHSGCSGRFKKELICATSFCLLLMEHRVYRDEVLFHSWGGPARLLLRLTIIIFPLILLLGNWRHIVQSNYLIITRVVFFHFVAGLVGESERRIFSTINILD